MIDKKLLTERVKKVLEKNDFDTFLFSGIFDVAGRREYTLLVKTLLNIDSLLEHQAMSLRVASTFLSAHPLIVSVKNNRSKLLDRLIYSRFGLPVVTPSTFEELLFEDALPYVYSIKGKHVVSIDKERMRKRRKELGYTMEQLAKKIDVSTKTIYEIETGRVNPTLETVEKLEKVLNESLKSRYTLSATKIERTYIEPPTHLAKIVSQKFDSWNVEHSYIYSRLIDIMGKKNVSVATTLLDTKKITIRNIARFGEFFDCWTVFIAKRKLELPEVPSICLDELEEINTFKEFLRLLKEKQA